MSDVDLEGVVVESSNQGASTTIILLLENLKVRSNNLLDSHLAYSSRDLNHRLCRLDVGFEGDERR